MGRFDRPVRVTPQITDETEIVLLGGRVDAESLVAGYRAGLFPMDIDVAVEDEDSEPKVLAWFCPDPRGVLTHPGMHISRSLRTAQRRFTVSLDEDFEGVLQGCADPRRPHGWITPAYQQAYRDLHTAGVAHSVEVWQGGELVGGLLGLELGGVFCADSTFHRVTTASKVARAELSRRLFGGSDGHARLVDVQWRTDHLASLGGREMPRTEYLRTLPARLELPTILG